MRGMREGPYIALVHAALDNLAHTRPAQHPHTAQVTQLWPPA